MSKPEGQCCCCGSLFSMGLSALFLWLILRPYKPTYSIEKFYVPALDNTVNGTGNSTVIFDLRLKNRNINKGIYYDTLNVTLYYGHNLSFPVGGVLIPEFYQGYHKKAYRVETVNTVGVPWETAKKEVSNGTAVFRVDLETKVRYKYPAWKTRRHSMRIGVDVEVDDQGTKSTRKGVKLSGAPVRLNYCARVSVALVLTLFLLF